MTDKVTLYIAEHNMTGKKYFGRTEVYFTEKDLQKYYHGSGKYWKNHLKKHGNNVTMIIYGIFSLDEVEEIALKFSHDNNIVESDDWANLITEIGVRNRDEDIEKIRRQKISKTTKGRKGKPCSKETKQKLRDYNLGKKLSKETKQKMRKANIGKKLSKEHIEKIAKANKGQISNFKGISQECVQCPYCGKVGGNSGMKRWHFDNCKEKK